MKRPSKRIWVKPGQSQPRRLPRKLKKQWRKYIVASLDAMAHHPYKLRWVPFQGWTVTIGPLAR